MEPGEHAPQQVSYHDVVLILTPTVVRVEVDVLLAEPVYFQEVVEHTHHCISAFTHINCFIDEVVDLTWNGFTAYPKDGTFPGGEEVHGARLEGVIWVEYLLGHVKGVVCCDITRTRCCLLCRWWWAKITRRRKELVDGHFGGVKGLLVEGALLCYFQQVQLGLTNDLKCMLCSIIIMLFNAHPVICVQVS